MSATIAPATKRLDAPNATRATDIASSAVGGSLGSGKRGGESMLVIGGADACTRGGLPTVRNVAARTTRAKRNKPIDH